MSDAQAFIQAELAESAAVYQAALADERLHGALAMAAGLIEKAVRDGRQVYWAGNGGSAADAQHLAAELLGRMNYDRPAMTSVALTTNTSTLTAIANDYGYENVFSRQMDGLGKPGDVFIGISTSGTSANIVRAMEVCKAKGVVNIGFCGQHTAAFAPLCDVVIAAPSKRTPFIQQVHILAGHIICGLVELAMYPAHAPAKTAGAMENLMLGKPIQGKAKA